MQHIKLLNPALLVAAVLLALVMSHGTVHGQASGPFAYVANRFSDDVSVLDTSTNTVVATVVVGDLPAGVAVSPDGATAYVTNFVGDTVSVIDTSTNMVVATVAVGDGPNRPAVTPDGARLYVPNGTSGTVSVIDTSTNTVIATVLGVGDARHAAVTPDGTRVYLTRADGTPVSVIDTSTNTVTDTVDVGGSSHGIAITPDGAFAYVPARPGVSVVAVIDTDPASPGFHTVVASVEVGVGTGSTAVTPDGTRVYVVDNYNNSVHVINTADNTLSATLAAVAGDPNSIAITPEGTRAYVTSTFDVAKVIDIDPASPNFHTVTATVSLGDGPAGIAMVPPRADLLVTKVDSPAPLNALRPLTYTVTVTNNGPQEATGVTLTDTLPAGVSFNSATPTQGSCDENAGVVTCGLGPLADGASATVTIVVAPQSEGTIENTVTVTANEADPDTGDNTDATQTTVNPAPVPVPSLTQWGFIGMAGTFAVLLLVGVRLRSRRGSP